MDRSFDGWDETPTVEVRVWRHGQLLHAELCESDEQAAAVVERWQDVDGVRCEVDDLSVRHRPGDVFEPDPPDPLDDEYQAIR